MPRKEATPIKNSELYKNECVRLAERISPRKLLIELNKVYRSNEFMQLRTNNAFDPLSIFSSFAWAYTPQGFDFWNKLHYGY